MGKKGEDTKKLIREKAVSLFARKGFKNVTMKDICSVTGLSRGGLYRHYNSTQQIFSDNSLSCALISISIISEKICCVLL